jgi:hypothetical protein
LAIDIGSIDGDLMGYFELPGCEKEMLGKSGGTRGVPLIDVEGIIIHGYNPRAIKDAVERRRSS